MTTVKLESTIRGIPAVVGKVLKCTSAKVFVRTPDGLTHVCARKTGQPFGNKNVYRIATECMSVIDSYDTSENEKTDHRKSRGVPSHWNV